MRVWLDDMRPMPIGFDVHVRTHNAALAIIDTGKVSFMSFDHDLGDMSDHKTGYDIAMAVERMAANGTIPQFGWSVHSSNPVGAERIKKALTSADRFWSRHV